MTSLVVYLFLCLIFIFEGDRKTERKGDRGSEVGSVLTAEKPSVGLELMNHKIVT